MRLVVSALAVLIAGCGASRPAIVEPPHAVAIEPLAVASYALTPVTAKAVTKDRYGARDLFEPVIHGRDRIAKEAGWHSVSDKPVDRSEIDFFGACVRDYILAQPPTSHRVLIDAFAHYVTQCDVETGRLVLERPLGFDARDRQTRSDAVFIGELSAGGSKLALRLTSCGSEAMFERIKIEGSGMKWTSPRLEVRRTYDGCDVAEVPYTRGLANMLIASTEREALITFEGTTNEITVDEVLRDELRNVIDAVDAITVP